MKMFMERLNKPALRRKTLRRRGKPDEREIGIKSMKMVERDINGTGKPSTALWARTEENTE